MNSIPEKQVPVSHYGYDTYVHFDRWASIWHQSNAVLSYRPESVLEVGGGKGYLKHLLSSEDIPVTSMDIDPDLNPDILGGITDIPCKDGQFDVACAFEVLEHLPYTEFLNGISELLRVSRRGIAISIPDKRKAFPYLITIPGIAHYKFLLPKPLPRKSHEFDGEHYWECNSKQTPLKKILRDLDTLPGVTYNQYLCVDFPYHRFFIIRKTSA